MIEWLTFIGGVISALAWPASVVWLLLAYKKPVRKILNAVAKRVADLEEVSSPMGGAKFSERVKEVAENLQEGIEDSKVDDVHGTAAETVPGEAEQTGTETNEDARVQPEVSDPATTPGTTPAGKSPNASPTSQGPQRTRRLADKTAEEITKHWAEIFGNMKGYSPLTEVQPSGSAWSKFESRILHLAKVSPRAAVIEAWSDVERSAGLMISAAYPNWPEKTMVHRFGKMLRQMGFPEFWIDAFEGLRRLRNYAAHEVEFAASSQDISQYAATAWTLKESFDDMRLSLEASDSSTTRLVP